MEIYLDLGFLAFGLGFFSFGMRMLHRDHREAWEQRMAETREFGFKDKYQQKSRFFNRK